MAHIYWIKLEDHKDMTEEGYIGVSLDAERRFRQHISEMKNGGHTNTILQRALYKYGEDKIKMQLVLEGDEDYCYLMEAKLRPEKLIGWNIAIGGNKPPVTEGPLSAEHKAKISKANKGNSNGAKKIEVDGIIYESIKAYADAFKIKYGTVRQRIYRNFEKWGIKIL